MSTLQTACQACRQAIPVRRMLPGLDLLGYLLNPTTPSAGITSSTKGGTAVQQCLVGRVPVLGGQILGLPVTAQHSPTIPHVGHHQLVSPGQHHCGSGPGLLLLTLLGLCKHFNRSYLSWQSYLPMRHNVSENKTGCSSVWLYQTSPVCHARFCFCGARSDLRCGVPYPFHHTNLSSPSRADVGVSLYPTFIHHRCSL